jgi:hypothetical protein
MKKGDQATAERRYLELISLPNPQLLDLRPAIRCLEAGKDPKSLAKAYEITAAVMQAIITAPPETFAVPVPEKPPGERDGGPQVEVQMDLDGVWQIGKGAPANWLDPIKRKQHEIGQERHAILCKLAKLYRDKLNEPKKAVAALRQGLVNTPFFTMPLEKAIAQRWPLKNPDMQQDAELGVYVEAARDLATALANVNDLDAAIDVQNRVILATYTVAGPPYREIEKLWSLLKKRPADSPPPRLACLNLLSPDRPSVEFDLDKLYGPRTEHRLWQLLFAARPGFVLDSLELAADMEGKGGYVAVECETLRNGTTDVLGSVDWHKDKRRAAR